MYMKRESAPSKAVFITSDISLLNTHLTIVMEWVWLVELMGKKSNA
jgi:hypothetical protein